MKKGWLVKFAEWVESHHLYIAQQLSPIILSIVAIWIGVWIPDEINNFNKTPNQDIIFWLKQWTPWIFFFSVLFALYGGIRGVSVSRKKDEEIQRLNRELQTNSSLSNNLEEAQLAIDQTRVQHAETIFSITSDYLGHLSNDHLGYNDTERVSLYLHNGSRFIIAGRYSKNLNLIKVNRSAFPDNEGCIGQTWLHGGEYFVELPDDEQEYYNYLISQLDIDRLTVRDLRMKSKAYCSFALEEGYKRIGIVMFESISKGVLKKEEIKGLVNEHKGYLIEMLKRTKTVNALVAYQNQED